MGPARDVGCCGITRRGFLLGAGTGLVGGAAAGWFGLKAYEELERFRALEPSFTGRSTEDRSVACGIPGPFPGRVIEVNHPDSVRGQAEVNPAAVKQMMDRGLCALTGADHPVEAWKRFFGPGDVVGIKVNPVGMKDRASVGAISSPAVLLETVAGLRSAGIKPRDIIVFERYAVEFRKAGYEAVLRERIMDGVRWYASSVTGGNLQVDISGRDYGEDRDPHVVGYDPDAFVHMGFAHPDHDKKDDRRFRSHLSMIVTRLVDKIITLPVLKDHRSAGVTLALKNLSHGMNNNVARSHISNVYRRDGAESGPNQCNTFIPTAVSQPQLRQKATLHILDGLVGVYEGGPGSWNRTWATWPYKSLFFATDPVAMDHVGWDIIDAKRAEEGWRPVAQMGLMTVPPGQRLSARLSALAAQNPTQAAAYAAATNHVSLGWNSEVFDRRQPEHIILAAQIGLGVFDAARIEHRRIDLKA